MLRPVVLDTNVFVAAAFNRGSASAGIVNRLRRGELRMVWNEATQSETRYILRRIPPLSWSQVAPLFRDQDRFAGEIRPEEYHAVPDGADRVFAALAAAAGAVLITSDEHLLAVRHRLGVTIRTPKEFAAHSK